MHQVFIDMKYKDGSMNTDDQITGLLIALLFAGQHTSSVTSTWTTLLMCTRPDVLQRVTAEVDAVLGKGDALAFDHLNEFETMHNCVREALRLFPPLIMLMRKVRGRMRGLCCRDAVPADWACLLGQARRKNSN